MADWQYAGSDAFGTSANTVKYNHRQQEPMQAPYMGSITVKQIAVNGVPATMQLDTQSVVTRISAQLWEELKSLRLIDDSPSACEVTCPSGAKVQFRGMTRIVISIAGKKVETTAFVEDLGDDMDLFLATNVLNDIPLWKELWQAIGMEDLAPAAVSNVSPPNGFVPAAGTPEQQQMKKKTKHRRSMPCIFAQLGCCRNGNTCSFDHGEPPSCKYFDNGHCRFGKFCLFKHTPKRSVAPKTGRSRDANKGIDTTVNKASSPAVRCVNQHGAVLGTPPYQGPFSPLRASTPVCRHYFEGKCTWGSRCRFRHCNYDDAAMQAISALGHSTLTTSHHDHQDPPALSQMVRPESAPRGCATPERADAMPFITALSDEEKRQLVERATALSEQRKHLMIQQSQQYTEHLKEQGYSSAERRRLRKQHRKRGDTLGTTLFGGGGSSDIFAGTVSAIYRPQIVTNIWPSPSSSSPHHVPHRHVIANDTGMYSSAHRQPLRTSASAAAASRNMLIPSVY